MLMKYGLYSAIDAYDEEPRSAATGFPRSSACPPGDGRADPKSLTPKELEYYNPAKSSGESPVFPLLAGIVNCRGDS
jgi:hypothetical protein